MRKNKMTSAQKAEYDAWLKQIASMSSGIKPKYGGKVNPTKIISPAAQSFGRDVQMPEVKNKYTPERSYSISKNADPRILYRGKEDLIQREFEARQRTFVTAPLYNKGGPMLVTPETQKDISAGLTRRR